MKKNDSIESIECLGCGAPIHITDQVKTAKCQYCQRTYLLKDQFRNYADNLAINNNHHIPPGTVILSTAGRVFLPSTSTYMGDRL